MVSLVGLRKRSSLRSWSAEKTLSIVTEWTRSYWRNQPLPREKQALIRQAGNDLLVLSTLRCSVPPQCHNKVYELALLWNVRITHMVQQASFEWTEATFRLLITDHAKHNEFDVVNKLLERYRQQYGTSVLMFTAVLRGCAAGGHKKIAFSTFKKMTKETHRTALAFALLTASCTTAKEVLKILKNLIASPVKIRSANVQQAMTVVNSLLHQTGETDAIFSLLVSILRSNPLLSVQSRAWLEMLKCCTRLQDMEEMIKLMPVGKVLTIHCNLYLKKLSQVGSLRHTIAVSSNMSKKFPNVILNIATYIVLIESCLVRIYRNAYAFEMATTFFKLGIRCCNQNRHSPRPLALTYLKCCAAAGELHLVSDIVAEYSLYGSDCSHTVRGARVNYNQNFATDDIDVAMGDPTEREIMALKNELRECSKHTAC